MMALFCAGTPCSIPIESCYSFFNVKKIFPTFTRSQPPQYLSQGIQTSASLPNDLSHVGWIHPQEQPNAIGRLDNLGTHGIRVVHQFTRKPDKELPHIFGVWRHPGRSGETGWAIMRCMGFPKL
jgi:hypothetical protein